MSADHDPLCLLRNDEYGMGSCHYCDLIARVVERERKRIWAGVNELPGWAADGVSFVDEAAVLAVIHDGGQA